MNLRKSQTVNSKLMQSKIHIVFSIIFFSIIFTHAQDIRNIGTESGLSNNQAYSISQDRKGFIWISTKQGIDRFDGTRIVNYTLPIKLKPNSHIKVRVDNIKNIWAYTSHGDLFYLSYANNRFIHYKKIAAPLLDIFFDAENRLWAATTSGLFVLQNGKLTRKLGKQCVVLCSYDQNSFLIADNYKVYIYNIPKNKTVDLIELKSHSLNQNSQNIVSLFHDVRHNQIWIGTVSLGVFCYNINNHKLTNLNTYIKDLPQVPVWRIKSFSRDVLCFSTDGGGIFFVNKKTYSLNKRIQENVNASNTIKGNGIYDIFIDDQGAMYSVSFTGGLSIIKTQNKYFEVLRQERNNSNSLSNNVVRSILEDGAGDLWFATYNGVNYWSRKTNHWKYFTNNQDNFYLSLTEDRNGNVLAGSYSQGITIINKNKGIIGHLFPKNSQKEIGTNFIMAIKFDYFGNMWAGGYFGELSCYNPNSKAYQYVDISNVNALENNDSTSIFVASTFGAFKVNTLTLAKKEIILNGVSNKRDHLGFNTLAKITNRNEVWWGSEGEGLFCWNYTNNKVRKYTLKDGLPSDFVVSLLYDKDSLLWGGTDNGLFSINPKNSKITSYSIKDGLSDNTFSRHSMFLTRNKELLFGTNNGVTKFNSHQALSNNEKIKLYIDEFRIFNQPVVANQEHSPLKGDIDDTKSIKLKWSQHSFSFSFGNIDIQTSKQIYYQWKLIGLDNDWNISSNNTLASYTNVQPGEYEFVLKAVNRSDKNEIAEKRIKIEITPPFWETYWARFIILLLFAFIIRTIYLFYHKKQIQQYSDEKIDFFTKTAHDIKTPLSLIMAPLNELKKSSSLIDKEKYFINLAVSNVERLNTIVNQLMDFQKSDILKSQLLVTSFDVISFVRKKVEVFSLLAKKQDIDIIFTANIELLEVWMDIEKFERIVDNLISNAIKYTPGGGAIEVNIQNGSNSWNLEVKDNGIGISKNDQTKLFKHFYRGENAINSNISGSGVGLLLTKNYVLLHKGNISFDSTQGIGTRFIVTFKLGKSHYGEDVVFSNSNTVPDMKTLISENDDNVFKPSKMLSENEVKILLVEDNDELRNFLQTILGSSFAIQSAINGREAFEILDTYLPDIIISDVQMPEMDGLTFSSKIKNNFETSHIPIILLSALTQKDQILRGIQIGVDDYITKPFDIDLLIAKIHAILKNRELVRLRFLNKLDDVEIKTDIPNERDREFIDKALHFIQTNLDNVDFNKDVLAREMAVSQSLLYSKIKHLSGESPSDLIRIIRLKKSMELLKVNKYSVSEVAFMSGFNDSKYFSTIFKKYFGKSPSEVNK